MGQESGGAEGTDRKRKRRYKRGGENPLRSWSLRMSSQQLKVSGTWAVPEISLVHNAPSGAKDVKTHSRYNLYYFKEVIL